MRNVRKPGDEMSRFLALVDKTDACWLWKGHLLRGYGRFRTEDGKKLLAHRYAYAKFIGPIPFGLTIDHLCRVRNCVNPAHLEPVSNRENILRGDNMAARNARRINCDQGHPLTYTVDGRQRHCRPCYLDYQRTYSATRRKEKSL